MSSGAQEDIGITGAFLAAALLLAVLQSCRRSGDGDRAAEAGLANRRHSPAAGECDAAAAALTVTALVHETSSGEEHSRIALGPDGAFRSQGKIVGRISGGCVLDARGRVLRSVDANGIVYGTERELAGFSSLRAEVRSA
jgi:hypothetical protein